MRKVLVIGPGGSGKSTFARQLAARTGLPLIHLDTLYWSAGWVPAPNDVWDRTVAELIAGDAWVMDGNYGRTLSVRLAACDTVFFLDLPPLVCLWRVWRRSREHRGRSRPDLADGCPERLTWEFVWWILTYRRRRRPGIISQLSALADHQRAIVLRSSAAVRRYLDAL
ncbi:MAG: AAA family ATPase [Gemmatimonadota bacterium]